MAFFGVEGHVVFFAGGDRMAPVSSCQRRRAAPAGGGSKGGVITTERHGPVALVVLDRPEARNALTGAMIADLGQALADADADPGVAAVVLTGRDPAFCAGLDLKDLARTYRDVAAAPARRGGADAPRIRRGLTPDTTKPRIGAVNGPAVTGGLELALGCDFLIASERATFADTHARVGVMPAGGMTIRLPQLIGVNRARQMSLTGDFVDAATACAWGLVNEVVPHDELLPRACELAGAIAESDPAAIAELRAMYAALAHRGDDGVLPGRGPLVAAVDGGAVRPGGVRGPAGRDHRAGSSQQAGRPAAPSAGGAQPGSMPAPFSIRRRSTTIWVSMSWPAGRRRSRSRGRG